MTDDFTRIEEDDAIRVVVETIGGVEAAYEYTKRALNAGKHVVTANKQLVAEKGCELLALAKSRGVNYLFEASVGGGIRVLHPLTQCMAANYGILNGTTNYILAGWSGPAPRSGEGLCRGARRCGGHRRRTEDLHPGGSGLRAGSRRRRAHGGDQPVSMPTAATASSCGPGAVPGQRPDGLCGAWRSHPGQCGGCVQRRGGEGNAARGDALRPQSGEMPAGLRLRRLMEALQRPPGGSTGTLRALLRIRGGLGERRRSISPGGGAQ